MLQDLNYKKNIEIAAIVEIEQKQIRSGISKELIDFKKLITSKRYVHHVLEEQLKNI